MNAILIINNAKIHGEDQIDALKARYEACGIFVDQLMHYFAGIIIFVI